ncbi:MAG: DUF481 domain-containing protein [Gemmatimonadota bacterium]|nr:DUF481 domain-containing protein [Gemmatimonadota bacterium]
MPVKSVLRRTRYLLLAAFSIHLLPSLAAAQIDIESQRGDDLPVGISGTMGGDLTVRTGNVDFVQVGLQARLYDVRESVTTLLVGDGGFGFLGSSRFASEGLAHLRQTYPFRRYLSPEWYTQINYDRSQLLTFRALLGGGARTFFASGSWGDFGAGSALMFEHERLSLPDSASHPDRTTTLRWSNFLTLRVVPTPGLVVTSTTYAQPEFANPGDVRVLGNVRLATAVTEALSLTVSFNLRYDSDPPDGIAALDTTLRTGVTYSY